MAKIPVPLYTLNQPACFCQTPKPANSSLPSPPSNFGLLLNQTCFPQESLNNSCRYWKNNTDSIKHRVIPYSVDRPVLNAPKYQCHALLMPPMMVNDLLVLSKISNWTELEESVKLYLNGNLLHLSSPTRVESFSSFQHFQHLLKMFLLTLNRSQSTSASLTPEGES